MRAHRLAALLIAVAFAGTAAAKLPEPSEEEKAKAAETKAKADWSAKVAAYQLCKSQDKVVAHYQADAAKTGKDVKPGSSAAPCTDPGPYAPAASAPTAEKKP